MTLWDLTPPRTAAIGDHDVPALSDHLSGKRIALLVSGGIATMKAPFVARALRRRGADVVAFATREALRYTTADALEWSTTHPAVTSLSPAAEHLSDARPFDAYLLAPATYNTINKVAAGIADTAVTATLATALGQLERGRAAVLVAPTMHGAMHNAVLTASLRRLRDLGVQLIAPRDANGKHNLPPEDALAAAVSRAVSGSALRGARVLVTGGSTPVPIDGVRRITNRFRGRLGVAIALDLHLHGADVLLLQGGGGVEPPSFLPHRLVRSYDEYRSEVHRELSEHPHHAAVLSAGVADFAPRMVASGKIPSDAPPVIELQTTPKVIDEVRAQHPDLHLVAFKYQEGIGHEALMAIARTRLERGYQAVVVNRGEDVTAGGEQVAHLMEASRAVQRLETKQEIARGIVRHLERSLGLRRA
jgi:phosphopantothenoylcysteine decarboxylase/phosphopantothenate--cysteine ligase